MIRIRINGEPAEIEPGSTVATLLAKRQAPMRGVAVEVNRQVVPRRDHETRHLAEGDEVEIVTLVGGG